MGARLRDRLVDDIWLSDLRLSLVSGVVGTGVRPECGLSYKDLVLMKIRD